MSKSLSTILRGVSALALSIAGLATFAGVASATAGTPGAPTGIAASGNASGAITVSWTNPASTTDPIISYTVVESTGSSTGGALTVCTQTAIGAAGATNSCTYTPSTPYAGVIQVYSNSADGGSTVDTNGTYALLLLHAPSAAPTATVTNGGVSLAFTASLLDSGSAGTNVLVPTGYKVALATTGAVLPSTCTAVTTAVTCVVDAAAAGLAVGGTYTFKVAEVNAAGTSAYSSASSDVLLLTSPSAVSGATATVNYSTGLVTFAWSAVASNGGAAVTYTVKTYTGSTVTGCSAVSAVTCTSNISNFVTLSATPGSNRIYNGAFTVVASNGSASTTTTTTNSVTIYPTLGAPSVAIAYSAGLGVTITAPGTTTGLTGYNIQLVTCPTATYSASTCTAVGSPVFSSGTSYTFPAASITNGLYYDAVVSAVNPAGAGTSAAAATAVSNAIGNPTGTAVTVSKTTVSSATITWTAAANNGSSIANYTVTYGTYASVAANDTTAIAGCTAITALTCTVTGLSGGPFYFVVKATNTQATPGNTSFLSGAATLVGTPSTPTLAYTSTGVTVSWTALSAPKSVSSYTVVSVPASGTSTILCTAAGTASSCTISGAAAAALIAAGASTVKVYATDSYGVSTAQSSASASIALPSAPGTPTVSSNASGIYVTWTAVAGATSYSILGVASAGSNVTATSTTNSYLFPASALGATATYAFHIGSANGVGSSAYGTAASAASLAGSTAVANAPTVVNSSQATAIATALTADVPSTTAGVTPGAVAEITACKSIYTLLSASTTACGATPTSAVIAIASAAYAAAGANAHAGSGADIVAATTSATDTTLAALATDFSINVTYLVGGITAALEPPYSPATAGGGALVFWWSSGSAVAGNAVTGYIGTLKLASGATLACTVTGQGVSFDAVTFYNYCPFIGLSTPQSLSFSVVAVAPLGNSVASSAVTVANVGVPGPVANASVVGNVAGTTQTVTWSAPALNPALVTSYTVAITGADSTGTALVSPPTCGSITTTGTTSTCQFTSVVGNSYSVSIKANNLAVLGGSQAGTAVTVAVASATVPTAPAAPTAALAVTASGYGVMVSWSAPASSAPITGYAVIGSVALTLANCSLATGSTGSIAQGSGGTYGTNANTIVVTGTDTSVTCALGSATAATFTVKAISAVGPSAASAASSSITPLALPTLSNSVTKTGSTTAGYTVGWNGLSVGATSYTVTVTSGSSVTVFTTTDSFYSVPVSALSSGITPTITVAANNAAGVSPTRTAADASTTAAATVVNEFLDSATAPTTISLNWTASADVLPVTYTVTATQSGTTVTLGSGITGTSFSTAYSSTYSNLKVVAVTAFGNATGASVTNTYTALGTPAAPTLGSSTVGSTSTTITVVQGATGWVTGAPAASDTTVTYTGSITNVATGAVTACTLSTLTFTCATTANTQYTYSITESDFFGSSAALTGGFLSLSTVAGAPTITSVVAASDTSVTITWTAGTAGSVPTTGYVVSVAAGSTTTYCPVVLSGVSTSCTITGLVAATNYSFSVAALNAMGASTAATSLASGTASVTTLAAAAAPATPTALVINYPGYGAVAATWTAPTNNVDVVSSYTVTATGDDGATGTCTVTGTSATCVVPSNQVYTLSVVANNTTGSSSALTGRTAAYVNNAPALIAVVSQVSGTLSIAGYAPYITANSSNDTPITSYLVTATPATGAATTKTCSAIGTTTALVAGCTLTGLVAGATYSVSVVPVSAVGNGTVVMTVSAAVTSAVAPAAPTNVAATRNATGLAISWTAPATVGSGQLVGYWVTATDPLSTQQYSCPYNATYGLLLAPATSCSISGLSVGSSYDISITAITQDGAGTKQLSTPATKTGVLYNVLAPEPVMATFLAVTAKQKSVSALSGPAKTALNNLISDINDGAKITVTGYGTTKAIALARANAAANYLFRNGAAVHVTIKTVISKTVKTALVTVTSN